jgi:uncharacterized protein YndB with AHSA1/START domain
MRREVFLALVILGLVAAAVGAGPLTALTPDAERRLAAGEVLVELVPNPGGGPEEGVAMGVVDAPPERVFAALTDFAHYREWVPFVTRSDARPQADGSVLSAQSLRLPALVGNRSYKIRAVSLIDNPGKVWSTRWAYVPGSGNVVDTRGAWTVTGFGAGRSLATCHLFTDPGSVPHWAMNRATRQSLPWIFDGLRQQVRRERYLKN